MPKWARGEAEIEQLLARGELERVAGAATDGIPPLEQARKTAAAAGKLLPQLSFFSQDQELQTTQAALGVSRRARARPSFARPQPASSPQVRLRSRPGT